MNKLIILFLLLLLTSCSLNNLNLLEYDNSIAEFDKEISIAVENIDFALQDLLSESFSTSYSIDRGREKVLIIEENLNIIETNSLEILSIIAKMEDEDTYKKYTSYTSKLKESYNFYLNYTTKMEENIFFYSNYLDSEEYYNQYYKDYEQIMENDDLIDIYLVRGDDDNVKKLIQENIKLISVAKDEINSANTLFPIYDSDIKIMSNLGLIYEIYEDSLDNLEDGYFILSESEEERIYNYYIENYDLIPTESEWEEIIDNSFKKAIELEEEANNDLINAIRNYNEAVDLYAQI